MKINRIITVVSTAALIISCADESVYQNRNKEDIIITAEMPATRVAFTDGENATHAYWESTDGIYLTTPTQSNLYYQVESVNGSNATFTANSSGNQLENKEGNTVYATYPKALSTDNSIEFDTSLGHFPMFAKGVVENNALNLTFKPILAYLRITLNKEIFPILKSFTPTGINLKSERDSLFASGIYNLTSNTFKLRSKTSISETIENIDLLEQEWTSQYIPVIPERDGEIELYTTDSNRQRKLITARKAPQGGFKAGCIYTLNPNSEDFTLQIILSQKTIKVGYEGGVIDVNIQANTDFELQTPTVEWIHEVPMTRALQSHTRYLTIDKNTDISGRTAQIIYCRKRTDSYGSMSTAISDTLTIIQAPYSVEKSINIENAGSLSTLLSSDEKENITSLILTGKLNGDDIKFIREMPLLVDLDLKGASIISGGGAYYSNQKTSDNIIGDYMFHGTKLKSIILPQNLIRIGAYSFASLPITSLTIPEGVDEIKAWAFSSCPNMTSITLPKSLKVIRDGAFNGCFSLKDLYISDLSSWCEIYLETTKYGNCSTPFCSTGNYSGGTPGGYLYLNGKLVTEIEIPSSITKVNDYVFYGMSNITSVTIPLSISYIGDYAFCGCKSLNYINMPMYLHYLGDYALSNTNIESITIPDFITEIQNGTFAYCSKLKDVTLPYINRPATKVTSPSDGGLTTIEDYAFLNCISLPSIKLPNDVTSIGKDAFSGCSSITEITLSSNLTTIGDGAFSSCENLNKISLPGKLSEIGSEAFRDCKRVNSIEMPNTLTYIGSGAFYGCVLTSLYISDMEKWCNVQCPRGFNQLIGNPMYYSTNIYINGKVESHIKIPEGITEIKDGGFCGYVGMKSLTLPKTITNLRPECFHYCTNLAEIYCHAITPPTFGSIYNVFMEINENCILYVPSESVETYRTSKWGEYFTSIQAIE